MIAALVLLGVAAVIAAFGLRDFGQSFLLRAKTDQAAFEESLDYDDLDDDDDDTPPRSRMH